MNDVKDTVHLQGMLLKPGTGNGEGRTGNGLGPKVHQLSA